LAAGAEEAFTAAGADLEEAGSVAADFMAGVTVEAVLEVAALEAEALAAVAMAAEALAAEAAMESVAAVNLGVEVNSVAAVLAEAANWAAVGLVNLAEVALAAARVT
jgi:hypothetical protein